MKCLYCQKEIISKRKTKKFCDGGKCKQAYFRKGVTVTEVVPVTVTKKVDSVTKVTVTEISVTNRDWEKELKFTKEMSLEKRIEKYQELYPDSSFVPNWVAHGFNSKEEAIKDVLKFVRKNTNTSLGLGGDEE